MSEPALAVEPLARPPDATVSLPGSKSETNRALVCAALAADRSVLRGTLYADDTVAMAGCVRALGARVEGSGHAELSVDGTGGALAPGPVDLDARMSGTTARFIAPVAALGRGEYRLDGHQQLRTRPMGAGFDALRALGAEVREEGEPRQLPATIVAPGGLAGGDLRLAGDVSSQFLSGLLLAAPCMTTPLTITVDGPLVSAPYVELTIACMRSFGAEVVTGDGRWTVAPTGYRASAHDIEPDASAASYFFAAAAVCGGRVRVDGLGRRSVQGDVRFVDLLAAMGADVEVADGWTEVRGSGALRGVDADLSALSDTAPTLGAVAAFADGPTTVTGIGFIRGKESDRIAAVVAELRRCGVDAEETTDGFVVRPGVEGPHGAVVQTYDDHRIAMAFAVLGLRVPGVRIADPACVAKTFPGYFEALDQLRVPSPPS